MANNNTMNRIIEIRVAEDCKLIPFRNSLQNAIGYLSMWGNSEHVVLWIDKDYNIEASHKKMNQQLEPTDALPTYRQYYFIMGLYDAEKDSYSFHS
jgi:heterodisulfide reductase subunit B